MSTKIKIPAGWLVLCNEDVLRRADRRLIGSGPESFQTTEPGSKVVNASTCGGIYIRRIPKKRKSK